MLWVVWRKLRDGQKDDEVFTNVTIPTPWKHKQNSYYFIRLLFFFPFLRLKTLRAHYNEYGNGDLLSLIYTFCHEVLG